ncbi:MAG: DUF4197 domain-containing protein [Saprospiraceae bacterium]|nr:DUF4197 domain-containing protein [Saprospiraceae bacterium]MBK8371024.1 DUF4197 domain-containing protein [Saprospiraceae bacterium]MBK8546320.1 DUF4197 domain-containing protein [Saprospiraceae bacterium]
MRSALFSILMLFALSGNAQFKDLLNKAKNTLQDQGQTDYASGLKEALELGVGEAVNKLSAEKGYLESPYKILIPEEAKQIISKVKMVPGFQDVETKLIDQMNKAAELAAKKATPIFVNAIKQMTIQDATSIVRGEDNAATLYLEKTSRQPLYDAFLPVVREALDEINARTYWASVVKAYNNIPFVKKLNPELDAHVNHKALDGLFSLIAVKEKGIRTDVNQRTSDLLKKVFGK